MILIAGNYKHIIAPGLYVSPAGQKLFPNTSSTKYSKVEPSIEIITKLLTLLYPIGAHRVTLFTGRMTTVAS